MSTTPTNPTNPLLSGLIGKEFLFDENLFITNFNPFDTRNTAGLGTASTGPNLAGLKNQTTITGKLLVFDTLNYDEDKLKPAGTADTGIRNTKTLSDILAIPGFKRFPTESTPYNQFSIQLSLSYEEPTEAPNTGTGKGTRRLKMSLADSGNSQLNIFPQFGANISGSNGVGGIGGIGGIGIESLVLNQAGSINITDEISSTNKARLFCIFQIDKSIESTKTNSKAYTDITENDAGNLYRFWYIPSEAVCVLDIDSLPPELPVDTTTYSKFYLKLSSGGTETVSVNNCITPGLIYEEDAEQNPLDSRYVVKGYSPDTNFSVNNPFILKDPLVPTPDTFTWAQMPDLPDTAGWAKFLVIKGYIYFFQSLSGTGQSNTTSTNTYRVPLNINPESFGSFDSTKWENVTTLFPRPFSGAKFIQIKNWLFAFGVTTPSSTMVYSLKNYYCEILDNGDLSTWKSLPDLPAYGGVLGSQPLVINNRVYFIGGINNTSRFDTVLIGEFQTEPGTEFIPENIKFSKSNITLPELTEGLSSFVYGNRIFYINGYNDSSFRNTVYSYEINQKTGDLQAFRQEANFPINIHNPSITVIGSKVYTFGGQTGGTSFTAACYVADLSTGPKSDIDPTPDAKLGTFRSAGNFPVVRVGPGAFIAGNYIYQPAQREGSTWANSKKLYRADLTQYIKDPKIDYTEDTYTTKAVITKPYTSYSLNKITQNAVLPLDPNIVNDHIIKEATKGFESITVKLTNKFTELDIDTNESISLPKQSAVLTLIKNLKVNFQIKEIKTRLIYAANKNGVNLGLTNTEEDLDLFLSDSDNVEVVLNEISPLLWEINITLHLPVLRLLASNNQYQIRTKEDILSSIQTKTEKPNVAKLSTLDILGDSSCFAAYPLNGNGNNLSGNFNASAVSGIVWTDEPFGQVPYFNGTNGYIRIDAAPTLLSGYGGADVTKYTTSFWYSLDDDASTLVVGQAGVGESVATNVNYFRVYSNGIQFFRETGAGVNNVYWFPCSTLNGKWYNLTGVFTNTTLEVFLDGISLGKQTVVAPNSTAPAFYVASEGTIFSKGKVAQLRFFNKNLSYDEIKIVANELRPFIEDSNGSTEASGSYNNYGTDLIPNTKDFSIVSFGLNPNQKPGILSVSGKYKQPTFEDLNLTSGTGIGQGSNTIKEVQQLTVASRQGAIFYTGKNAYNSGYVYMYAGPADSTPSYSYIIPNILWRSKVLNDGSLEGFTQIGTNDLKLMLSAPYIYGGYVYLFGGFTMTGTAASINSTTTIRRAKILLPGDPGVSVETPELIGTIGAWENCGTLPFTAYNLRITPHLDNPAIIYITGFYGLVNNVAQSNTGWMVTYKFTDSSLPEFLVGSSSISLLTKNLVTSGLSLGFVGNPSYFAKNQDNENFLYIFGTSTEDLGVYRLKIGNDYKPVSGIQKVGTIDKPRAGSFLVENKDSIYIIGGSASTTNYKYGGSDTIIEFKKSELFNISYIEPFEPTFKPVAAKISETKFPLAIMHNYPIKTDKGYFIISPLYTTVLSGSYSWASTPRIFCVETNEVDTGSTTLSINTIDTKLELDKNIKLNKIGYRPIEELYSNLFVKGSQTLTAYGETIKFVNPFAQTVGIELEEITSPVALPRFANIFLKWIEELSTNTALDNYNQYLFTRDQDILIPEVLFNILYTKNLLELNKTIFKGYLITNPPSAEIDPNEIITNSFIDEVLYCFSKSRVRSSNYANNKTSLIYNTNGLVLPDLSKIDYSSKPIDYQFIFFPQRHNKGKGNFQTKNIFKSTQTYLDLVQNLSSVTVDVKTSVDENGDPIIITMPEELALDAEYFSSFDYFVAPNGNDANSGRLPSKPKKTLSGISNSKVLLLPGTYTSPETNLLNHVLFNGIGVDNDIYGCGSLTIIDRTEVTYTSERRDKHIASMGGGSRKCYLVNCTIKYDCDDRQEDYMCALFSSGTFYLQNVRFEITGKYSLIYNRSLGASTATFANCTFVGGTRLSNYDGTSSIITVTNSTYVNYFLNITQDKVNQMITYFNVALIKDYNSFRPIYTLLPLGDNVIDAEIISETDVEDKNIILDFTTNITDIKNLSVKL